jgi:hypothetical protein
LLESAEGEAETRKGDSLKKYDADLEREFPIVPTLQPGRILVRDVRLNPNSWSTIPTPGLAVSSLVQISFTAR